MTVLEVGEDRLAHTLVNFDPDDINGAMAELTARWIASGEVAHPDVIEAGRELIEATNRHDWDALAVRCAGATYVNHRQLGDTTADFITSVRTMASLVPDLWIEPAEIISYSAMGFVTNSVFKGTSTEGGAMELPLVMLGLFDGDRVTHVETFDPDQRDLALARFEELNRPT